jgi:hypothetical protein
MSAGTEAAILVGEGGGRDRLRAADRAAADRAAQARAPDRPGIRLMAFAALAFYGTLRWGTLMSPAPFWRLLGVCALAVALAWVGGAVAVRSRAAVAVLVAIAVLTAFALSGVPFQWVRHFRIAVTADGIGQGLSALPRVLVPYLGINPWIRTVITLGAAVLLLDAALIVALSPGRPSDARRAAAAIPLIALAVVPATLARPTLSYVHGLLLFLLVAAFMWGDRIRRGDGVVAAAVAVLAGAAAMIAAPALDHHKPWLDYEALAGQLAPAHVDTFDWRQRYGPLHWPRDGREVLDVQAKHPDYWKTENLSLFDGRGWTLGAFQTVDPTDTIAPRSIARWTQTIHVTIRAMKTSAVIVAGVAQAPTHAPGTVEGFSDGTWGDPSGLGPGDSYEVSTYDPHPSPGELRAAGVSYPQSLLLAYLTLEIPGGPHPALPGPASGGPPPFAHVEQVLFPPFASDVGLATGNGPVGPAALLAQSSYGPAYQLAKRLERRATNPYDFVMSVKRYLDSGAYRYDESPPVSRYPLLTFLFNTKRGYCQQFAGAMAMLLRMGGVPARVSTGFTTGTFDHATNSYMVSDLDAHAWVEAWFPGYGWVRFDPTPAAAPARGGHLSLAPIKNSNPTGSSQGPGSHGLSSSGGAASTAGTHHGGGFPVALVIALAVVLGLVVTALALVLRLREPTGDELLVELERAYARCGRPVRDGTTLAELERRLRDSPDAQAYVRALRMARFAGTPAKPSREQRKALRGQLRAGLGLGGRLRAMWALPPQLMVPARARPSARS